MKIFSALSAAWRTYCRHFGDLMKTLLVTLCVGGMALAPLLFLNAEQTRPLAWLSLAALVLLVLPVRQNTAEALQVMLRGGSSCTFVLISPRQYICKVLRGLRTMLWTLPLVIGVIIAYAAATGEMDVITLLARISPLGGGDPFKAIKVLVFIYLSTLLPIFFGLAFHSGTRHAAALGNSKLVRGHRLRLMALWLLGLVPVMIPLIFTALEAKNYLSAVLDVFSKTFTLSLDAVPAGLIISASALVVLLVLTAPLRALLPAVYLKAVEEKRHAQA